MKERNNQLSDLILDLGLSKGREPLTEYPWYKEIDHLLEWLSDKDAHYKSFCFDLVMSLAYIDATSGLEKYIEFCDNCPEQFNAHLGFINLCSPCYETIGKWSYQKAAKPQSGALGKLSSEIILRFILKLSNNLKNVLAMGGTESVDASQVLNFVQTWLNAREAYMKRDKSKKLYYLANASGNPPKISKERDGWPTKESIDFQKAFQKARGVAPGYINLAPLGLEGIYSISRFG